MKDRKKKIYLIIYDCATCPYCSDGGGNCCWDDETLLPEHIILDGGIPSWCPLEDAEGAEL